MKTLIKEHTDITIQTTLDLANGVTLKSLIDDAEKSLLPCAHCGRERPRIIHIFVPEHIPNHPHRLYAICWAHKDDTVTGICEMQSKTWYAEDNEEDFKEALRLIVEAWNRRPGKPDP